jgi:methylated-DNA-[protein]-cysteine S-methyltransferase
MSEFTKKVYSVVKQIPRGSVLTYKEVATLAGSPRAYRAVGNILNRNYDSNIPCHRVIKTNGDLGGYNRGKNMKKELLKAENSSLTIV